MQRTHRKITVLSSSPSPFCTLIKKGTMHNCGECTREERMETFRENADKLNATHLVINSDAKEGLILTCPIEVEWNDEQLQDGCYKAKYSFACFQYGLNHIDSPEPEEVLQVFESFKRSCELKLKEGCGMAQTLTSKINSIKEFKRLETRCEKNRDIQACMAVTNTLLEDHDYEGALKYAGNGCKIGAKHLCGIHQELVRSKLAEKQELLRADLQLKNDQVRQETELQNSLLVEQKRAQNQMFLQLQNNPSNSFRSPAVSDNSRKKVTRCESKRSRVPDANGFYGWEQECRESDF